MEYRFAILINYLSETYIIIAGTNFYGLRKQLFGADCISLNNKICDTNPPNLWN